MLGVLAAATVVVLGHRLHGALPAAVRRTTIPSTRRRTRPPGPDQWAQWLDAVAAHVRGGASLAAAVHAAHEQRPCIGRHVAPGVPLHSIVEARPDDPHEGVVTQVLAVAAALGGAVAATVQAGAALLRERAAVAAEAQAHAAQARLSARVLTAVPVVFAVWNLATSAAYRRAALTPVGGAAIVLGVVLSIAGWWWMRHLVHRAAR